MDLGLREVGPFFNFWFHSESLDLQILKIVLQVLENNLQNNVKGIIWCERIKTTIGSVTQYVHF